MTGSHDLIVDVVFYPQEHISAHFGNVCRTISWCADDPDYLVTGEYSIMCVCVCQSVCVCLSVRLFTGEDSIM